MKTALILDLETTGVSPETDRVVEIALVLYSLEHRSAIRSMSAVVNSGVGNTAEAVNRIPPALVAEHGIPERRAFEIVGEWMDRADLVIGHNIAAFDLLFLPEPLRTKRPVADSCHDLQWPRAQKPGEGLVKLALAHDLGVSHAHRASVDCDLLARLLARVAEMGVELVPFLERGLRPKGTFVACVPFERKDEAKAAGFQWDSGTRQWTRTLAIEDAAALPFPTRRIDAADAAPAIGGAS